MKLLHELKSRARCIASIIKGDAVMYRCRIDVPAFEQNRALMGIRGSSGLITGARGKDLFVYDNVIDGGMESRLWGGRAA